MIELVKAGTSDALVINGISKRSFDSDVEVGAPSKGGPPGYMSIQFHTKMARSNHLYKLMVDGLIIGGAILFIDGEKLNIGRIFISPEHHRKGYGIYMMQEIERMFPAVKEFYHGAMASLALRRREPGKKHCRYSCRQQCFFIFRLRLSVIYLILLKQGFNLSLYEIYPVFDSWNK